MAIDVGVMLSSDVPFLRRARAPEFGAITRPGDIELDSDMLSVNHPPASGPAIPAGSAHALVLAIELLVGAALEKARGSSA